MYWTTIVFFAFLFFFISMFCVGLHNIDNAWNLKTVDYTCYDEWKDSDIFGNPISMNNLYLIGMQQVCASFFGVFIMMYFMGGYYAKK